MNKTQLVDAVAKSANLKKKDAEAAVTAAFDAIAEALMRATGEKLKPMIYNDGSSPAADETAEPIDAFLSKLNKHNIDFIIEE